MKPCMAVACDAPGPKLVAVRRPICSKVALAAEDNSNQIRCVSIQEIKSELGRMSAAERAQVQGHLRILRWKESPKLAERLTHVHQSMNDGRKVTSAEIETHLLQLRAKKK
jgi:hypothetical protein